MCAVGFHHLEGVSNNLIDPLSIKDVRQFGSLDGDLFSKRVCHTWSAWFQMASQTRVHKVVQTLEHKAAEFAASNVCLTNELRCQQFVRDEILQQIVREFRIDSPSLDEKRTETGRVQRKQLCHRLLPDALI